MFTCKTRLLDSSFTAASSTAAEVVCTASFDSAAWLVGAAADSLDGLSACSASDAEVMPVAELSVAATELLGGKDSAVLALDTSAIASLGAEVALDICAVGLVCTAAGTLEVSSASASSFVADTLGRSLNRSSRLPNVGSLRAMVRYLPISVSRVIWLLYHAAALLWLTQAASRRPD